VAFYLSSNQVAQAANGLVTNETTSSPIGLLVSNFINLPVLWAGAFGTGTLGALGWFDTPMPEVVGILSLAAFAAVVFTGLRRLSWRKAVALAMVAGGLVAVPLYVLYQSNVAVGSQVQPRYILPMLVIFAGVALFEANGLRIRFTPLQLWLVVAALSVAHALALHRTIRRFVTGVDVTSVNLNANIEWWWGGPVSPMLVWVAGSLAFSAAAAIAVLVLTRRSVGLAAEPVEA
jgi:hypothetical protein